MSQDIACPVCGTELSMAQLFAHEETHRAFARLATVSIPLGAKVLQYCTLFAPTKTRLTVAKQVKLVLQLLPDLERQAITYRGRDWAAPLPVWAQAIDQMLAARDLGRLELPMKGHGYLHAIVASLADKVEASAEQQRETERRTQPDRGVVQVRGQAMGIGQVLPAANRPKTVQDATLATLAALDARDRNAAPMPPEVRARLAALRGQPTKGQA